MERPATGGRTRWASLEKHSIDGMTVTVQKPWTRDDEGEWPEAAQWIKEQFERLRAILSGTPSEPQDGKSQSTHQAVESNASPS